jgi:membrane protein implicated in regulation of membrane protease activity
MAQSQDNSDRALLACSLWLHAGFIGAVAVAAGVILLFGSEASLLSALALVLSGGVLAAASWRRARTVLEDSKPATTVAARNLEKNYAQSD